MDKAPCGVFDKPHAIFSRELYTIRKTALINYQVTVELELPIMH